MVYIVLKELSKISEDVIIAVSILTKDITSSNPVFRANAIRVISRIIDPGMLNQVERYIKSSIIDKDPYVASSALVSSYHLMRNSPDIVKRWVSEIQEASQTRSFVQYHALGVLYLIRQHDPMAVSKLIHSFIKMPSKLALTHCFLIRASAKILTAQVPERRDKVLLEYIYSCLRHGGEMVIFEAARQICNLPGLSAQELEPAVSSLQVFLSSPKPTSRFAAIKTISKISNIQPRSISDKCIIEMEKLLADTNRFVSTLAATTLLQVEKESAVEGLLNQVSTFIDELYDDFKIQVVEGIRTLSKKFPAKTPAILTVLSRILKKEGGFTFKRLIVDTFVEMVKNTPEHKEKALKYLSEFIEDCEFPNLATRILHLLGEEGPKTTHPMTYIRSIYNRVILETEAVRASAVNALAQYSTIEPEIVSTLLKESALDNDDQVRDKTTFYLSLLDKKIQDPQFPIEQYLVPILPVPIDNLERALHQHLESGLKGPFDIIKVSNIVQEPPKPQVKKDGSSVNAPRQQQPEKPVSNVQELFKALGKLLKSSKVIPLTEQETEYQVTLTKHMFSEHIILEFNITNTLDDIALNNVYMEIEPSNSAWVIESSIPWDKFIAPFGTGTSYSVLPIPLEVTERTKFACTMKFDYFDFDTVSHEVDDSSANPDEYPVDDFTL